MRPVVFPDEFLAPIKRLLENKHLIERVQGLEEYYKSYCKLHSHDEDAGETLGRYAELFRDIDAKTPLIKEALLQRIVALKVSDDLADDDFEIMERFLLRPLSSFKGVGPKIAALLGKKNLNTIHDLIFFLPYQYVDKRKMSSIRELQAGRSGYFRAKVADAQPWSPRGFLGKRGNGFTATVGDGTGFVVLKWFYTPPPFIREQLKSGAEICVFGKVDMFRGQKEVHHPEVEPVKHSPPDKEKQCGFSPGADEHGEHKLLPQYFGLPQGLSDKFYRRLVSDILGEGRRILKTLVPGSVKKNLRLVEWGEALYNVHFPQDDYNEKFYLEQRSPYHLSLLYQELFLFFALFMEKKAAIQRISVPPLTLKFTSIKRALDKLHYELTGAQKRALHEIKNDLEKPYPMQRLLQGDVGSGKTIVALLISLMAIDAGKQAAVMAPTEILAGQHYLNFKNLLNGLDIEIVLVVSGMKKKEKEAVLERVRNGAAHIIVGTHALIQEGVNFKDLGLAVIDEQHRFGVDQRSILIRKGAVAPHSLYMTATPIPRTLAMTVHGDLNLSIIDEMPPGRKPVKTAVLPETQRERAFAAMRDELKNGRQAYVVYPVIDEKNLLELKAATQMYELIKEKFPDYTVALLHGRLKSEEKEAVMKAFKAQEIGVLVSTTVIEVGVDVPNAGIMIIEHGERFGLSQLHQLRGRIGRGADQAQCIVLVETKKLGQKARERLMFFRDTADGFKLAEFDLKLRGPGEMLGTKQSGIPEFNVVDIIRDAPVIEMMKNITEEYFKTAGTDNSYGRSLHKILGLYFSGNIDYAYVG